MYAKILIILVLAILCTGCTDPDLPDLYEFENVTPGAPALQKSWNPETQTITISTLDDTPRLTVTRVSMKPDLCTFEEVLEIKSFVSYELNELKDFRIRWQKLKGQQDITKVEWFILKNESYDITVNDYETIQVEETHYDNITEEYYNISVNQTVLIGNHSEVRFYNVWKPFSPVGKSIHVGQTYTVKIVYHKLPELGDVRIQTIPMFAGVECDELTWWNTSWAKRVQRNVNNASVTLTDYQLMNTTTYDSDMQADFDDLRFTNESGTLIPYWIESKTDSVSVDIWLKIPSISTTEGATVWMYYNNSAASSASSGDNTFIQWHGAASTTFLDSLSVAPTNIVCESKARTTADTHNFRIGLSNTLTTETDDCLKIISFSGTNKRYMNSRKNNVATNVDETPDFTTNTYYKLKIINDGTNVRGFVDGNQIDVNITTNIPTDNMGLSMWLSDGTGDQLWSFVRKYTATEPTWAADGEEEAESIITAYTPSTPLSKTTGDSQLFTVNTSENSQCRWYINGSLKQTNSTGTTRHEYTNTSLGEGYWNFTATANTTDRTSSQTWWVTVSAVGTFEQDMYIDRWMYVTYLDSSNTNLSEFFIDLAPYYLSFYNVTDQKTYNYKSGRWEKYADTIIKPGEAAMLRYTANVTKTRDNADGTFGFTMKTGLNHIGHSYNGSHNLTWYNTTIASANVVTITHQNSSTGTISTFTYGSADNGSVDVLQGFGVEVNVSADTVISGL